MTTPLYHVGCGRYLFDLERANGMALACACGANAPIMVLDLDSSAISENLLPASLYRAGSKPHIEYYLGFDYDFTCPAKLAWEAALRLRGCVGFAECDEERCQREPAWQLERRRYFEGLR